uniref:VWA7 N-terminal domain-containing protein n=1 Tax=Plectus sambesii TaxID=2011161 RepID=A0A914UKD6_9BILA
MTHPSLLCLLLTVLALPNLCDCFGTTGVLAFADPLKTSRFHDTITNAAVCKVQYDWLIRKNSQLVLQSPNPLEYKPCPYDNWASALNNIFLPARAVSQEFAASSIKPDVDQNMKNNPIYHFDSDLKISDTNVRLIAERTTIINALKAQAPNYNDLRASIGASLHTIQDFYSHTNWIEMGKTQPNAHIAVDTDLSIQIAPPEMAMCSDCSRDAMTPQQLQQVNDWENNPTNKLLELLGWSYDPLNVFLCKNNIVNNGYLTSGYISSEEATAPKIASQMKCSHGGGADSSSRITATGGINKDTNSFLYSPHYELHSAAADMAVQATIDYLEGIRVAVNNENNFGRLLGLFN